MARKTAYRRPAQHTLEYDIPKDVDLERAIINHILAGVQIDEPLNKLDEDCFTDPQHKEIFFIASELFRSHGTLTADQIFDRVQITASDYRPFSQLHIEYYTRVLHYLGVRRLILRKCLRFIDVVQSGRDNVDTVINEWVNTGECLKAAQEPSWLDTNQGVQETEDWYISPDDSTKYLVLKGKKGLSDYCMKDGKFLSEPKMLFMGYRRVSLPKRPASDLKDVSGASPLKNIIDNLLE